MKRIAGWVLLAAGVGCVGYGWMQVRLVHVSQMQYPEKATERRSYDKVGREFYPRQEAWQGWGRRNYEWATYWMAGGVAASVLGLLILARGKMGWRSHEPSTDSCAVLTPVARGHGRWRCFLVLTSVSIIIAASSGVGYAWKLKHKPVPFVPPHPILEHDPELPVSESSKIGNVTARHNGDLHIPLFNRTTYRISRLLVSVTVRPKPEFASMGSPITRRYVARPETLRPVNPMDQGNFVTDEPFAVPEGHVWSWELNSAQGVPAQQPVWPSVEAKQLPSVPRKTFTTAELDAMESVAKRKDAPPRKVITFEELKAMADKPTSTSTATLPPPPDGYEEVGEAKQLPSVPRKGMTPAEFFGSDEPPPDVAEFLSRTPAPATQPSKSELDLLSDKAEQEIKQAEQEIEQAMREANWR